MDQNRRLGVFIVGAQKADTAALYEYLKMHSQVAACDQKELHFFTCDNLYRKGNDYYHSLFPVDAGENILFDMSTSYLVNHNAPMRIRAYNRDAKIIVILTDAVSRTYPAWNMYRRPYGEDRNYFFQYLNLCQVDSRTFARRPDDSWLDFSTYIDHET